MVKKTESRRVIGEKIKLLREKRNLNQSQLADALGIKNQTISNYESGEREPSYEILLKLSDYFGTSIDYLFGRTNIIQSYTIDEPYEQDILEFFEGDNTREEEIKEIINKFYDVINYCSRNKRMDALSRFKNVLTEILNFLNSEGDSDTKNFRKVIKFIKSENNTIPLDSAFKLKFKHKNIENSIDELNSFFIAIIFDSIDKYSIKYDID